MDQGRKPVKTRRKTELTKGLIEMNGGKAVEDPFQPEWVASC